MMRTHRCGDLRAGDVGADGRACADGSRTGRDHGGVVFLDLRDTSGLVQVVVDPDQSPV